MEARSRRRKAEGPERGRGRRAAILAVAALWALVPPAGAQAQATETPRKAPRVALVLSGGSALGMAHAGVIEFIEKAGIPVDMVLGTSMGSIVGGLYASGMSPAEMQATIRSIDWAAIFTERRDNPGDRFAALAAAPRPVRLAFDRSGPRFGEGLLEGQHVLEFLTGLCLPVAGIRNFDLLPIPFRAVAADLETGERVVLAEGSLAEAMRASMSIPGVFAPWEREGRLLVDGGIVDNMPVDLARELGADIVIAVEARTEPRRAEALGSGMAVAGQAFNLLVEENMRPSRKGADLLIKPDLARYGMTSFSSGPRIVEIGREAGQAALPALEALAARIARDRPLVPPEGQPNRLGPSPAPILSSLDFAGASPSALAAAFPFFAGLEGKPLERASLTAALEGAWGTGLFDVVTVEFAEESPGRLGARILLEEAAKRRDEVLLGLAAKGVLSPVSTFESSLSPALYARDLAGRDSGLLVETELGARLGFGLSWFQPFGPFYARPSLSLATGYRTRRPRDLLRLEAGYREAGIGASLGAALGQRGEVELGWSLRGVEEALGGDSLADLAYESRSVGELRFLADYSSFDRRIFPRRGYGFSATGRLALPALGGDRAFQTLGASFRAALPLGRLGALGLRLEAGSDLYDLTGAAWLPAASPLPQSECFDIVGPGLFRALPAGSEGGSGNQVLAAALEFRRGLGLVEPLTGSELLFLAETSAALARSRYDPDAASLPLRWEVGLGLASRLAEGFGLSLFAGLVSDGDPVAPTRPFLALEFGPSVGAEGRGN